MASKNKTYIQKAIDKTLKSYESPTMDFLKVERDEVEVLRNKLNAIIAGNEAEYAWQVEDRLQKIEERIVAKEQKEVEKIEQAANDNFEMTKVKLLGSIPKEKIKLQRDSKSYKIGKAVGIIAAVATASSILLISCGHSKNSEQSSEQSAQVIVESSTPEPVVEEPIISVETISEKQQRAEATVKAFLTNISKNTTTLLNELLANGVRMVEFDTLTEEQQKELIASMGLQYYFVANIDDITTLEYANFMKEKPNAVLANDDLIYNFRNFNVLLKQQMLVSTPNNKIDFANIYQNEYDAKLLNDGADLVARLNAAKDSKERKEISKEIYAYIQNTILNSTSELKYSNSAMATFINVEFSAWKELTKNSGYKYGFYPDDELEAKLMTVVGTCGMSKGEKDTLKLQDETKTSLESINIIRVLNTLDERKGNILTLTAIEELYYVDGASYGDLKQAIMPNIDLAKYRKIQSYAEKKEEQIKNTPKQVHANDSGISNGQGGTIANTELEKYNINSNSSTAKQEYEQKVEDSFKGDTVVKNEQGEVIDQNQAAAWAQQGAIDANNGTRNNNVPSLYQDAYNNGWNAANSAKNQVDQSNNSSTVFVPESNGPQTETIIEETVEGFKDTNLIPDGTPSPNPDDDTKTTFVPVEDGEITETVIGETTEGFASQANASRTIEIKTLSHTSDKVQTYKDIKSLLQQISNSFDTALDIYSEIEENHMTK